MTNNLYSTLQTADILGTSGAWVRMLAAAGKFPNAFKVGRAWLIPAGDIEQYQSTPSARPRRWAGAAPQTRRRTMTEYQKRENSMCDCNGSGIEYDSNQDPRETGCYTAHLCVCEASAHVIPRLKDEPPPDDAPGDYPTSVWLGPEVGHKYLWA